MYLVSTWCPGNFGASLFSESFRQQQVPVGSLSKPRPRRQRERHQTKRLMSKTIAAHVHYKSLYISLRFSGKQERTMTKFCFIYGTWTTIQ